MPLLGRATTNGRAGTVGAEQDSAACSGRAVIVQPGEGTLAFTAPGPYRTARKDARALSPGPGERARQSTDAGAASLCPISRQYYSGMPPANKMMSQCPKPTAHVQHGCGWDRWVQEALVHPCRRHRAGSHAKKNKAQLGRSCALSRRIRRFMRLLRNQGRWFRPGEGRSHTKPVYPFLVESFGRRRAAGWPAACLTSSPDAQSVALKAGPARLTISARPGRTGASGLPRPTRPCRR